MTHFKTGILASILIALSRFNLLQGGYFDDILFGGQIDMGYRWDRIDETIEIVDSENILPYSSSEKMFKSLQSYQLGGRVAASSCNFIVKGEGHYGWIESGDFSFDHLLSGKAIGNTYDLSAGVGYAFCICDCFRFVPLIGYSYDHQHLDLKHFESFDPDNSPNVVRHGSWSSAFYGPWLGFDVLFDTCLCDNRLSFNAGYEFHYGKAKTKFSETFISDIDETFSYHANIENMMGQVFRLDSRYEFYCNFFTGIGLQYTYWGNAHKTRDHFGGNVDPGLAPSERQQTLKLSWHSFALTFDLGMIF